MQAPGAVTAAQQYSVSSGPATPTLHESVESLAVGGVLPVHEYPVAVPVHPTTVESAMHVAGAGAQVGEHESTDGVLPTMQPTRRMATRIDPVRKRMDVAGDGAEGKKAKSRFMPGTSTGGPPRCYLLRGRPGGRFGVRGAGISSAWVSTSRAAASRRSVPNRSSLFPVSNRRITVDVVPIRSASSRCVQPRSRRRR